MTRRCHGWDYCSRAIYMITLVQCERRQPRLGRLAIADGNGGWVPLAAARSLELQPEAVEAQVVLSPLGEAILAHWKRIAEFTPEIKPYYCQIMPDHLHAILEVTRPMKRPLGNAIGGFKTGCEKLFRKLALPARDEAESPHLWADGFQDSILFRAGQLENMFNYLSDNPRRLAIKGLFPDLFRVVCDLRVKLLDEKGTSSTLVSFSALGNRFLLDRPLLQVQVSRRDCRYQRVSKPGGGLKIARDEQGVPKLDFASEAFEEKCEELLLAAKHGMVLISPCVSDGEREIARRALAARLPLVTLANKGFSPLTKPSGRYFDACAEGLLLMLAPIAWPHVPGAKPMTREDALVLNRLAQQIAGPGAAEINYHGVRLADIDTRARAAVGLLPM